MAVRIGASHLQRAERLWNSQTWLRAETLESLAELNEQCLELLCEQARSNHAYESEPLMVEMRDLWRALDITARKRASWCPYLLFDAGFLETRRWAWVRGNQVHDAERVVLSPFFTVPRTIAVMRLVLAFAWHLARSQQAAARLLMGMSTQCAELISACTLRQVTDLAEHYPQWLQPRWPGQLSYWRELLISSITGDAAALERARMHGIRLLAADARAGTMSYFTAAYRRV